MDRYRFILGSLILIGLLVLAVAVALGKVEEKTSGLTPIMAILAKVALDFSEWAFRPRATKSDDTADKSTKEVTNDGKPRIMPS